MWWSLAAAIAALLVDRVTKEWAVTSLDDPIVLLQGVLELSLTRNAAILWYWQPPQLVIGIASLVVLGGIIVLTLQEIHQLHRKETWGLVLMTAGAISNSWDRLQWGYVIDFISVPFWSVFNLADTWMVCGLLFLLLTVLRKPHPRDQIS